MIRSLLVVFAAVLLGAVSPPPAAAQRAAPQSHTYWLTGGVGRAEFGAFTEIGAHLSAAYQFGGHVAAVRSAASLDILGALVGNAGDVIAVQDVGVLLGHGTRPGSFHASGAAGLGVVQVTRTTTSGGESSTSHFGVPFELQLFWRPTRVVGVGLYTYGNLNRAQSFWGWSVSIEVGRLR